MTYLKGIPVINLSSVFANISGILSFFESCQIAIP